MITWVCIECGCEVAGYGVCRCFDDDIECLCPECAEKHHDVRLVLESAEKPVMNNELDQLRARVKELEASNAELLEALKDCCVIARPKNPSSCCPAYRPGVHGGCAENEDCECNIWKAIQKAKEERQ